ncbi:hypothetical protein CPB83DRAFT_821662 [Crepidotus variabilis]|uniref:DUF1264-domain-containing protein n=1 Tax=Crepidotus variabilis TaxID=179855 RepID=A0A9P6E652_9AGAR|nr:hypothetical protein CPB83DRAFT_821662 [Crepidotus variabilis]
MSADQKSRSSEDSADITNNASGNPTSVKSQILSTAAGMLQEFEPVKNICAFLNAFHVYADEPSRAVESHHYCSHVNEDVRQCLIYDSNEKNARLIGVEYMITPQLYETLDQTERRLWHSHVFEVKSGMLIMPKPSMVPEAAWELAETKEMEDVIQLYGKVYHFWQVDRGDKLPLGQPKLMASITNESQVPGLWERVAERDRKLVADYQRKKAIRQGILEPQIHPDADQCRT